MSGAKIVEDILYQGVEVWRNSRNPKELGTVIRIDTAELVLYDRNNEQIHVVPLAYAEPLGTDELATYYENPDFDDPRTVDIEKMTAEIRQSWDTPTTVSRQRQALSRAERLGENLRKTLEEQ